MIGRTFAICLALSCLTPLESSAAKPAEALPKKPAAAAPLEPKPLYIPPEMKGYQSSLIKRDYWLKHSPSKENAASSEKERPLSRLFNFSRSGEK